MIAVSLCVCVPDFQSADSNLRLSEVGFKIFVWPIGLMDLLLDKNRNLFLIRKSNGLLLLLVCARAYSTEMSRCIREGY